MTNNYLPIFIQARTDYANLLHLKVYPQIPHVVFYLQVSPDALGRTYIGVLIPVHLYLSFIYLVYIAVFLFLISLFKGSTQAQCLGVQIRLVFSCRPNVAAIQNTGVTHLTRVCLVSTEL